MTFPVWRGRCGFAVEEVARRHGDFALAGAVRRRRARRATPRSTACAIGLFGLGSTPVRATAAEAALVGAAASDVDPDEVGRARRRRRSTSVPSDLNGSAAYRVDVGAVVVARAVRRAVEEALDA